MPQKANYFKLGLFVILALALTAGALIAFGAGRFFRTEILAETCFDESVQGLDIGSDVKYKGVKIGTVKSITTPAKVYKTPSNYVLVTFSLAEDCYVGQTGTDAGQRMKKAVAEGLTISLAFKGLTGAAYLETDYRNTRGTPLDITWDPASLYVPSRKSSIKRIGETISQVMDNFSAENIKAIADNVKTLSATINQKADALDMSRISDEAVALLKELRHTNRELAALLDAQQIPQVIADAGQAFADLKSMARNAREPVGKSLENIETASAGLSRMVRSIEAGYGPRVDSLLTHLDATLQNLEKTSGMLGRLVWLNSDTINTAIRNFEYTSDNLNQLTLELKKYPGRLLLEKPPKAGPRDRFTQEVME